MNRYCVVLRIKEPYVENYVALHKNAWPELLQAIRDSGAENLIIYRYHALSIIFYECEDIDRFYREYGSKEVTKKWNATVNPWLEESPALDGSAAVETLEKIFDYREMMGQT